MHTPCLPACLPLWVEMAWGLVSRGNEGGSSHPLYGLHRHAHCRGLCCTRGVICRQLLPLLKGHRMDMGLGKSCRGAVWRIRLQREGCLTWGTVEYIVFFKPDRVAPSAALTIPCLFYHTRRSKPLPPRLQEYRCSAPETRPKKTRPSITQGSCTRYLEPMLRAAFVALSDLGSIDVVRRIKRNALPGMSTQVSSSRASNPFCTS